MIGNTISNTGASCTKKRVKTRKQRSSQSAIPWGLGEMNLMPAMGIQQKKPFSEGA